LDLKIVDEDICGVPAFDINNINQSFLEYTKWKEKNNVGEIWIEGHGVQAFLHIMLTYCIPLNHILLIDEPEIHLYPSVKRKFGNALGTISQNNEKQFFCVTHDSDFLQGIFDSKCEATIIKIKKNGRQRELIHKQFDNKTQYLAGQTQTPFLQIPFLDAAIIVEGATDRLVYEYVFFDNKFLNDVEYKFISAGGKDSISNPIRIASDLKVPYVVILDIENLKEKENSHLIKLSRVQNEAGFSDEIAEIGLKLKGIENLVTRGVDAIIDLDIKLRVNKLIDSLKVFGIFIVHKGTLESWGQITCEKKSTFPERFIDEYTHRRGKFDEMVGFLKEIESYIRKQ
jgi:predicted ATP-dependent endonuclease of OLD family